MKISALPPKAPSTDTLAAATTLQAADAELLRACQEFESIFLQQILSAMRSTIPQSGLWGESQEKKIYEAMFDEELAKKMAFDGGIGLAKILYEQLRQSLPNSEQKDSAPLR